MKATFWDKRAEHYDDSVNKYSTTYRKMMDSIKSLLTNSDVILDFGCATGETSLDISKNVRQVHGIDLSSKMIELAHQKVRKTQFKNIEFSQIDVFDSKLESNSFNAIIAFNIIHLLEDIPKVLNRLNDLLDSGGLIISLTPCLGEKGWLIRSLITFVKKLGLTPTIRSLKITELESQFTCSNFEIIETKVWNGRNADQLIVARKTK